MTAYRELTTVGDLVVRGSVRAPDRTALVVSDERVTYAELEALTRRIARSLDGLRGIFGVGGLEDCVVTKQGLHVIAHLGIAAAARLDRGRTRLGRLLSR